MTPIPGNIVENALIETLTAGMPRSERQIGGLQECDAELIRLPGTDTVLAVTTDSIAEEIELGLYDDFYLIGWMAVAVNASDLAAVGADPIGILLSETLPQNFPARDRSLLQAGIREACSRFGLPVLGGDTNTARQLQVGGTAIGFVEVGKPLTRVGSRPGDLLFASGRLGLGSAFALAKLVGIGPPYLPEISFKPEPRLREGQLLRSYASACMDTSDGALAAIDQLMRLNGVGFVLKPDRSLHPAARSLAETRQLPSWMMLAGLHGEFELLFTVPPDSVDALSVQASSQHWQPVLLGHVVHEGGVWLDDAGGRSALDTGRIRNLFAEPFDSIEKCILRLKTMEEPCTQ